MKQDERTPVYTEGVCNDGAMILRDGQPFPISSVIDALNAYGSTDALRSALELCVEELETNDACIGPMASIALRDARAALSASPAPDNDLSIRLRAHVERLANTDMQLPLDEWCGISNDILRCADAMASGCPSISASPAPSTEGLREALAPILSLPDACVESLRHQRQVDADGCEVGVSRQAVDEIYAAIVAARTALAVVTVPQAGSTD